MATCHYHCVDVFTQRAFGGNQLTVSPDASGLTDVRMQLIARQLILNLIIILPVFVLRDLLYLLFGEQLACIEGV